MTAALVAGGAFALFAILGYALARWLDSRPRRSPIGRAGWIVPLAVIFGGCAGYGSGSLVDEPVLGAGIGAGIGLVVGVALLLLWLDAHPRVRGPEDAYALTGIPTSRLDDVTEESAQAMVLRWLAFSDRSLVRVAIVPASGRLNGLTQQTAHWLQQLHVETAAPAAAPPTPNGTPARPGPPSLPRRGDWRARWRPGAADPDAPAGVLRAGDTADQSAVAAPRVALVESAMEDDQVRRSDVLVLLAEEGVLKKDFAEETVVLAGGTRRPEWVLLVSSLRTARQRFASAPVNGGDPAAKPASN